MVNSNKERDIYIYTYREKVNIKIDRNTPDGYRRDLTGAIDIILEEIKEKGPFDGILGFSQVIGKENKLLLNFD